MDRTELLQRIIAHGADEAGIRDRFGDNEELYINCFCAFLEEENFGFLKDAIQNHAYDKAFEAAHALKGLCGNLGVTACYDRISDLVEALRHKQYGAIEKKYERVQQERLALASLCDPQSVSVNQPVPIQQQPNQQEKIQKSRFVLAFLAILAAISFIAYLFCQISMNFKKNIKLESSQHLTEMSNQIRLYVEEQVTNDWKIAYSVRNTILTEQINNETMLAYLEQLRTIWQVSDLQLYTKNGYSISASGTTEKNDIASEIIINAQLAGKYMTVIDSRIYYTIPVETTQQYQDSTIAAISVVQDMATFLDDMHFSSFDEQAWLYLCEENGIVISMLSNTQAPRVFNIKSLMETHDVLPLMEGLTGEQLFFSTEAIPFLLDDGKTELYTVSVPVEAGNGLLWLFYLVPEAVVNQTMNGFFQQLTLFSLLMVILFALLSLVAFLFAYKGRKKRFAKELLARDRMFDLLMENTNTAFGLFALNQKEPTFVSSNAMRVIQDEYWVFFKDESGYHVRNKQNTDSAVLHQVNTLLCDWDGVSSFKSGYIRSEKEGQPYYFEFQLYPVDEQGEVFVGIAQDVTQTYQREDATRNAMEMAKRSNEAKSRFLSNMSHDIRTPMNAIMNMTDFALENMDQPKKLGLYLHTIRESSQHLLHLINDVLDMSRIESGQTVVVQIPFHLKEELQKQVDIIKPLCEVRKQTLITDFSQITVDSLCGDAMKLSQIIMNLLSNAVKFTPSKGAVRFTAQQLPSLRDDLVNIRFTIEDNGIGISEADLPYIFEPFNRTQSKRVGTIEGTGLGLSICKSYVEAMGGTLHCESEEGEGSTFIVELFFQKAESTPQQEKHDMLYGSAPFLGMKCLVAEDNRTNQLIAKTLLERLGFLTEFVADGHACVQKFLTEKPGKYDVIYMDIQMPVLDGYQAAMAIRRSIHAQANSIVIIAMTANVFAEDIEKARVAGMDGFIGKPVVSFDLVEQTEKALRKKKETAV